MLKQDLSCASRVQRMQEEITVLKQENARLELALRVRDNEAAQRDRRALQPHSRVMMCRL